MTSFLRVGILRSLCVNEMIVMQNICNDEIAGVLFLYHLLPILFDTLVKPFSNRTDMYSCNGVSDRNTLYIIFV
jgi:hypothetical protein